MNSYALSLNHFALGHSSQRVDLLNDLSEKPTPLDIKSLVASGDLFAVLATEIDEAAVTTARSPSADISSKLDKLTAILLHLQRHYKVISKRPDYRQ